MKFIKKFQNHNNYNNFITSENIILPNVSYCVNEEELHYNLLPYDYEIEYLQSSGTQYIDTEISTLNSFVGIDTYISFPTYTHDRWAGFYNNYSSGNRSGFQIGMYNNNIQPQLYNAAKTQYVYPFPYDSDTHHFIINCKDIGISIDSEIKTSNQINNLGAYGGNILLFKRGGNIPYGANCRIGKTKIYLNNNQLIRNFIPVKKNNIGYMYDTISNQLFENNGTGNFILGPII